MNDLQRACGFKTDISKIIVSFTQLQSGSFLIESTFEMIMIKKSLKMDIDQKFRLTYFHFDREVF